MNPQVDIAKLLAEGKRLHRLLNSARCPADIDARHQAHFAARRALDAKTQTVLGAEGEGVGMHDAWIQGFSERRAGGGRRTRFFADTITFGPDASGALVERGYVRVEFDIRHRTKFRDLAGKEIYACLIDPEQRVLGMSYHIPGGMRVWVAPYDELTITHGPVRTWEQLQASPAPVSA